MPDTRHSRPGREIARALTVGVTVLLLAIPLAVLLAVLARPVWIWFEQATDIESFGHSGPATWCYAASYAGSLLVLVALNRVLRCRPPAAS